MIPNNFATKNAEKPETIDGSKISYIKTPTVNISIPKIAPASGVPKTEANPALIPQITIFFLSLFENLNFIAKKEAKLAPICALGPSFPTEPPEKIVSIVAKSFTGTTLKFIFPEFL